MKIDIYGKENCVWCTRAKDECFKFSRLYDYYDVYKDLDTDKYKELFETIAPYAKTFPIVVVDGNYIGGYTELKQYLNELYLEERE